MSLIYDGILYTEEICVVIIISSVFADPVGHYYLK